MSEKLQRRDVLRILNFVLGAWLWIAFLIWMYRKFLISWQSHAWLVIVGLQLAPLVVAMYYEARHPEERLQELPYKDRDAGLFNIVFGGVLLLIGAIFTFTFERLLYTVAKRIGLTEVFYGYWMDGWIIVNIGCAYKVSELGHARLGLAVAISICSYILWKQTDALSRSKGRMKLFESGLDTTSPSRLLIRVALFAAAYGAIHCAVSDLLPQAYSQSLSWQDGLYFSVVTIATVGYGDIAPKVAEARWACIIEIGCGVLFLVLALNVSASVWLQRVQTTAEAATQKGENKQIKDV